MLRVWEGFNGGGAQISGVNGAAPDLQRFVYERNRTKCRPIWFFLSWTLCKEEPKDLKAETKTKRWEQEEKERTPSCLGTDCASGQGRGSSSKLCRKELFARPRSWCLGSRRWLIGPRRWWLGSRREAAVQITLCLTELCYLDSACQCNVLHLHSVVESLEWLAGLSLRRVVMRPSENNCD